MTFDPKLAEHGRLVVTFDPKLAEHGRLVVTFDPKIAVFPFSKVPPFVFILQSAGWLEWLKREVC